ncbi:hypothetical protein Shyhy01_05380 [Streptomyces hygroscopicus subsp. hygroscopicus]|nr:hypothetical protein Shyhy01_05380 [Streptomyces hygroscopicus subsp. hygroscopicus]
MLTGLSSASGDSITILCVTGQAPTHVLVDNACLGLIRQAQPGPDIDFEADPRFGNINAPETGGYGVDHVRAADITGAPEALPPAPARGGPSRERAAPSSSVPTPRAPRAPASPRVRPPATR